MVDITRGLLYFKKPHGWDFAQKNGQQFRVCASDWVSDGKVLNQLEKGAGFLTLTAITKGSRPQFKPRGAVRSCQDIFIIAWSKGRHRTCLFFEWSVDLSESGEDHQTQTKSHIILVLSNRRLAHEECKSSLQGCKFVMCSVRFHHVKCESVIFNVSYYGALCLL